MLVQCNGKEGMREAGGRRFESQVMQVCGGDTTGLVVVAGWLG